MAKTVTTPVKNKGIPAVTKKDDKKKCTSPNPDDKKKCKKPTEPVASPKKKVVTAMPMEGNKKQSMKDKMAALRQLRKK